MVKKPSVSGPESPPTSFPETPPPSSDMPSYSAQVLFEMSHTLGRIEGVLTSLGKQADDIEGRVKEVEKHWHWVTGAIATAIFLVPACAYAVWWSLSDKIEAVLNLIPKQ